MIREIDPSPSNVASPVSQSSSGKQFNIACYVNYDKFSMRHKHFLAVINKVKEPRSFKEAIKDVGWCTAMKEEVDAL